MNITEWLDKDGFIHLHKNPTVDQSENGPMFTGLMTCHAYPPRKIDIFQIWSADNKFRANSNREYGSHFSHDNMTGLYCMNKNLTGGVSVLLPIFGWNKRMWMHPRDVAFYFWAHYPRFGLLFLWIASLAMIISCLQTYKYRTEHGVKKKFRRTDGKLLTYLRCRSFDMHITFAICTWIIKRKKEFGSWQRVAEIYFTDENHPLRMLIK